MFSQARFGEVLSFDEHSGLGSIRTSEGDDLQFHCITISDNSRTIEVGARVRLSVFPSQAGRVEAESLDKI